MPIRWYPVQTSFKGGEISPRYFAQIDEETTQISCAEMTNYIPTLQGPAVKRLGTIFQHEAPAGARLLSMQSVDGRHTLVELTNLSCKVFIDSVAQNTLERATAFTKQVITNGKFKDGLTGWYTEPTAYKRDGKALGAYWQATSRDGEVKLICRRQEGLKQYTKMRQSFVVDTATTTGTLNYRIQYTGKTGKKTVYPSVTVKIGTTLGGNNVYNEVLTGQQYSTWDKTIGFAMPSAGFTGTLYAELYHASAGNDNYTDFLIDTFQVFTAAVGVISDVTLATPYTAAQLKNVQYVQSPYDAKEVVFVHRDHPPQELLWDTGSGTWKFQAKSFTAMPVQWVAGNYPQVCTAFQGRLVVGGTPSQSETVWFSKAADWSNLTLGSNANDGMAVTVTYRSPLRWLHGHKNVIAGAGQFEYAFQSQSGLLTPSDTQVTMQSSHGSAFVQPANLGFGLLFASEGGKKARVLELSDQDRGWLAPDVSRKVDHLLKSGIVRTAVVRAPQQMVLCVCNDGTIACITLDRQDQIAAWCRLTFNGQVKDICVMTDNDRDTPYIAIERSINGQVRTYIEAMVDMDNQNSWQYMDSAIRYTFDAPTTTITGLAHLEGMDVFVTDDKGRLVDTKTVSAGIVILDSAVMRAIVGTTYDAQLQTMPAYTSPQYGGIGSIKRYSEIGVRLLQSAIPEINGKRPPDRSAITAMNFNEPLYSGDVKIASLGYDTYAQITISEPLPLASVIVGIFGKLNSSEL
jgi:hypothetical protein